ncbi:MAG: APC family permease [Nocardioidaceae bacterium]
MSTTGLSQAPPEPRGSSGGNLRREIGPVGLLFAGIGSIIGSGWLFGALNASQQAGPAAIFSWIIGGIMIMLIGLVYAELGTMFPLSGGVVRFPHIAFGSFASFSMGWVTWVAAATVAPIEVEGALQYATKYAAFTTKHTVGGQPVHTLTALGYLFAVLAMAVFVVINYIGVKWFSKINNVLVWWKLAIISLVVIAFLVTTFHTGNFTDYGFKPAGWKGVFTAIATSGIVFSYLGFRQGIELAGETSNPKRNVPLAVIGSILVTGVIYVLLQVAFIAAVRPQDLASSKGWANLNFTNDFGPLAAIATLIGLGWLAVLLYIDAIVSPADTGLIYTTVTARISYAMARNGNAPDGLAKTTSRGVPLVSLIVTFVVGLVVFLPFPSWQQLVGFITSATVLSFGSGPLVYAAMRRQLPDQERPFRLPFGDVLAFLAFWSATLIVYWAGWTTNWKLFVAVLIGYVLLVVLHLVGHQDSPPFEFRSGMSWILPWFGGLALMSYAGDYGGGQGWIGFGTAIPIAFVFSLIIYVLAIRFRLPIETVQDHIERSRAEAATEDAELGGAV